MILRRRDAHLVITAIEEILSHHDNVTVLGDLNLSDINWHCDPPKARNTSSNALLELAAAWDLTQLVPEPTRGSSWLDLILTTFPSFYSNCRVVAPVATSDHDTVVCYINLSKRLKTCSAPVKRIDYTALQCHLASINWTSIFSVNTDINWMWDAFSSTLVSAIEACSYYTIPHSEVTAHRLRKLFLGSALNQNHLRRTR
jgi:hypothetical protein